MNRQEASDLVTQLYESWYSALVRYGWRITGSQATAQDAVQQTFMDLYVALVDGQSILHPKAWTLCVLRRRVAADWESWRETEPLSLLDQPSCAPVEPGEGDDDIGRLLSCLTAREQEVILLRLEAYKYREIAQALGISPNSVNTLLSRAIGKLQKAIRGERGSSQRRAGDAARAGLTTVKTRQNAVKTLH